jgi:hypothetical protein
VADHRPADDEYYDSARTELFSQGDIFREVPLAYPTVLGELEDAELADDEVPDDWLAAGKRRFLSGPLEFGHAMLITPTCAMSAQGASGYAHPIRTLVVVRPVADIVGRGILSSGQADDLRHRDRFGSYMYLPPIAHEELAESVALLYYPVTLHHDFLEGNRVTQLAYEGARQLQRKLGVFYAGFEVDRSDLDPPMD